MTVAYGGWYQRTTLHLTEIYDFFSTGTSHLPLSEEKLQILQHQLDLKRIEREVGYLEYVRAETNSGISIRYFEDGLYVLQTETTDIKSGREKLERYFTDCLLPAVKYLFSLGAPTPKVLANINVNHPTVVVLQSVQGVNMDQFGAIYGQITSGGFTVYKFAEYIFIVTSEEGGQDLADVQIFFREFKNQLKRYLDIHRTVWEDISAIKERQNVKGYEVAYYRSQLDSYQKTITLISHRINQMGTYVHTRATIARDLQLDAHLIKLFQFKFETLVDTLAYIKEIWAMTREYVNSAIQTIVEIEAKATNRSIKSLQIVTTIGVISGLLSYLTRSDLPRLTMAGAVFFALLILTTVLVEAAVGLVFKNLTYKVKFSEEAVV